jgi:large subunit ribosomal protein L19
MEAIAQLERKYRKPALPQVKSGDTVRVHHLIKEGSKQRIQVFEGVVIRTHRKDELTANITVRRIASGIGVEKTFLLHSPNVNKVEILRRAKVRRNFLSYLRQRRGKSARLQEISFDKAAANAANHVVADEIAEIVATTDEVDAPDPLVEESIDEVTKDEATEAAAEDAANDSDAETDNQQIAESEVEAGVEKAEAAEDKEAAK